MSTIHLPNPVVREQRNMRPDIGALWVPPVRVNLSVGTRSNVTRVDFRAKRSLATGSQGSIIQQDERAIRMTSPVLVVYKKRRQATYSGPECFN